METKMISPLSMGSLKNLASTEKQCNKCGFVTFSLRVLYSHRYKCQGQLLGSLTCCYCKRKFNYLALFKAHKKNCVKFYQNKTLLKKQKSKNLIARLSKSSKKKADSTKEYAISCSDCLKTFSSKQEYGIHLKMCFSGMPKAVKKQNFSARKSFSKVHVDIEPLGWLSDVDDPPINDSLPLSVSEKNKRFVSESPTSVVSCKWCKNTYPTKEILQKHLQKNFQCAQQQKSYSFPFKETYSARKSFGSKTPVVARKSFSHSTPRIMSSSFSYASAGGSARKSLPNSRNRFLPNNHSPLMGQRKIFNQCPICFATFSDSFEFFQHQRRLNHWGKATKSISSICKCPFCDKQFFHIRARNAHLRNHADKSEEEIEYFLQSSSCDICSKLFTNETAKYQHMKLEHPKSLFDADSKENRNSKQSLLPLVIKQKLKQYPNTCPICSKHFPTSFSRNKHFKKKHLDSELECKFCSQRYNSVEDLEYHMQKAHYNSFKFECLACKINLATAPHVVLHVTKLHAGQDPKKIIRSRDNESALFDEQGLSPYVPRNSQNKQGEFYCDICKVSFQRLCGLQSHRQSKSHRDTVVKNLDSMHKSLSDLPSSTPPVPKKKIKHPEILTCNECLDEFTTVKDFVPHRLSHFGVHGKYLKINEENLYTCEICGEVSNSHSKVQLHLFWHLQVESTSTEKNPVTVNSKNDPIVPDRLSGQHVAKKSFAKQRSESQQEVVIGGVKKPLFTCENCNIGFTTQAHYSLHVRKFCRKKNASPSYNSIEKDESSSMLLPGISTLKKHAVNIKDSNLEHCSICNCLFSLAIKELHDSFCEKCAVNDKKVNKDIDHITSNMDLERFIAFCILCDLPFDDSQAFANHMLACHKSARNTVSGQKTDNGLKTSTVHCTACNSLFFCPEAMVDHSSFCSDSSCCDFDADSVTDILKAASKLENLIAACISCSLAFDNTQNFNKHMLSHQVPNFNRNVQSSLNGTQILSSNEIVESASGNTNDGLSFEDLEQVSALKENIEMDNDTSENMDSSSSQLLDDAVWTMTNSIGANQSSDFEENSVIEPIDKLRNNFSQLFCMLINDPELMQQLGFGEQPVDDVLTKVLQQMGQNPVLKDDQTLDIDCLRKNIRMLLDFCLKDQIMELIGSGKTSTDEIVVEALKIFTSEKTTAE